MRRAALPLLILGTVLVAALLAWLALNHGHLRPPARGAGAGPGDDMVSERQPVPPFNAIDVSGIAEITLVQGDAESVTFESPAGQARKLSAAVHGTTLEIIGSDSRSGPFGIFGHSGKPGRIIVTFRNLDAIEASGAVRINAAKITAPALKVNVSGTGVLRIDDLQTDTLKVSGSGAFKAELAGKATEQVVAISGAGSYQAAQLLSDEARVAVSGAGKVVVNASKLLKVGLSGAGVVEYLGNPEVKQSVSGIGKVRRREAASEPVHPRHFRVALLPARRGFSAL